MDMHKIDLITGFLGAGKTTFIRHYAEYLWQQGEKVCILENDHGAINVDRLLLAGLSRDGLDVEMVAGGADYDCHKRRLKTKLITLAMLGYTRVIMEPSGIFDIDEFFDLLCEEPLDQQYEVANVITIIRADLESDLSEQAEYLLGSQAAQAGCMVFSHVRECDGERILASIRHVNHALAQIKCGRRYRSEKMVSEGNPEGDAQANAKGGIPKEDGNNNPYSQADARGVIPKEDGNNNPHTQVNTGKEILKENQKNDTHVNEEEKIRCTADILAKDWNELTGKDFEMIRSAGYQKVSFEKSFSMDQTSFRTLFFMNLQMNQEEMQSRIRQLFQDTSVGNIIRVKGFAKKDVGASDDEADWYEINATKDRIRVEPMAAGQDVIIVIGEDLAENIIEGYFPARYSTHQTI